MAQDYRVGNSAAPLLLALATTLSIVLLPLMMPPTVGAAAKQQPIVIKNGSLCSGVNGGGDGHLAIAQVQPELEGLEMTTGLGSIVVSQQSNEKCYPIKTGILNNLNKAGCGRIKPDRRYICCTTDPKYGPGFRPKCAPTNREYPCH